MEKFCFICILKIKNYLHCVGKKFLLCNSDEKTTQSLEKSHSPPPHPTPGLTVRKIQWGEIFFKKTGGSFNYIILKSSEASCKNYLSEFFNGIRNVLQLSDGEFHSLVSTGQEWEFHLVLSALSNIYKPSQEGQFDSCQKTMTLV